MNCIVQATVQWRIEDYDDKIFLVHSDLKIVHSIIACYNDSVMKENNEKKRNNKSALRIVIVGCGYFGQKRIGACRDLDEIITLVGVVDQDRDRAKQIGDQYGIPYGTILTDFTRSSVDAVIISTPNNTHSLLVTEALSYGWHVLCEKPLASSLAEAQQIVNASSKYKRYVKTGSNHRFFPTVQKAYELFQSGSIGELLSFKGSIGNNGDHVSKSWFWDKNISGGGTFIDNGCHLLDIARMFMGDFVSCVGSTANVFWNKTSVEDVGTGIFVTKDGRQAVISSSWIQWYGYVYFELWGDKGFIIVDGRENNIVTVGQRNSEVVTTYDFSGRPRNSYHMELEYFYACVCQNKPLRPDAHDGFKVIQMISGIYESMQSKKWVMLG